MSCGSRGGVGPEGIWFNQLLQCTDLFNTCRVGPKGIRCSQRGAAKDRHCLSHSILLLPGVRINSHLAMLVAPSSPKLLQCKSKALTVVFLISPLHKISTVPAVVGVGVSSALQCGSGLPASRGFPTLYALNNSNSTCFGSLSITCSSAKRERHGMS